MSIAMKSCRVPFYQTLATRLKTVDAIRQKSTTFATQAGGGQTGRAGRGGMTRKNRKMQQVKNQGLDFIAIDFETATGKRASVCEVGICAVRNGEIIETRSWLVQPEDDRLLQAVCQHGDETLQGKGALLADVQ